MSFETFSRIVMSGVNCVSSNATAIGGDYVAACGAEGPCTIWIYSVLSGRAREVITANVAYPHWNR